MPETAEIRRHVNGSIDLEYYEKIGKGLQANAIQEAGRNLVAKLREIFVAMILPGNSQITFKWNPVLPNSRHRRLAEQSKSKPLVSPQIAKCIRHTRVPASGVYPDVIAVANFVFLVDTG